MRESKSGTSRAAEVRARAVGAIAVLALACAVSLSAYLTKRSGLALPLLAVDVSARAETMVRLDAMRTSLGEARSVRTRADGDGTSADRGDRGLRIRYFDGKPCRPVRTVWMRVTAYSPDARSCGKWADGNTASMKSVWTNAMRLVAADPDVLPIGSMVSVPGYADGEIVPVLDVGGAIKGARLDVLYPSHAQAKQWGVRTIPVTVWERVDEGRR